MILIFTIDRAIFSGRDLIGRARTGQGKTLAFCLPLLEKLQRSSGQRGEAVLGTGKSPLVLIMTPTRELAKQIVKEFLSVGPALRIEALYGGTELAENRRVLSRGLDVVVGTPGRIKVSSVLATRRCGRPV